jgi:hypothetical protein
LIFGHSRLGYNIPLGIPACLTNLRDIVIFVHGWFDDEETAIDKFNLVRQSLQYDQYIQPVIGFSWDSDTNWYAAKNAAEQNGPKLARFIS